MFARLGAPPDRAGVWFAGPERSISIAARAANAAKFPGKTEARFFSGRFTAPNLKVGFA
jgi:hypothetical protein